MALGPLNWNVRIVDEEGRPTPEFLRKWNEQTSINASIPDASDTAAMSALLDLIGGTAGDMLRRGATVWEVIAADADPKKFLRSDGTWNQVAGADLSLTDVDTNNVSTARHGFAPKLPNDDTVYLDGTGAYSTPAGGGGGAAAFFGWPVERFTGNDTGSFATLANGAVFMFDVNIDRLFGSFDAVSATDEYAMFIATCASDGDIIDTVGFSNSIATGGTGKVGLEFPLVSTASLMAGTAYMVGLVITSGTGTTSCRAMGPTGADGAYSSLPIDVGGMASFFGAGAFRAWYTQNSNQPSGVASANRTTTGQYAIGLEVKPV